MSRKIKQFLFRSYGSDQPFQLMRKHLKGSKASLQVFYGIILYTNINFIYLWNRVSDVGQLNPPPFFGFLNSMPVAALSALVIVAPFVATATFFFHRHQWLRVLCFVFTLLAFAYKCSFNKNYHSELILIYGSFAFMLIPTWPRSQAQHSRLGQYIHLQLYWFGLLLFLLPYTLSGLWKLFWGMGYQYLFDSISFWNFTSMSYIVSSYMVRTSSEAPLADFIINHSFVGYFLLLGGTYWEVIAILPLFRPSHWKTTAFLILVFHILSILILNIAFKPLILAAIFFIYFTPLQKEDVTVREWFDDLPLLGPVLSKVLSASILDFLQHKIFRLYLKRPFM